MRKNNLVVFVPLLLSSLFSCNKDISNIDFNQNNPNTISLDAAVLRFQNSENKTISRSATNANFVTPAPSKTTNIDYQRIDVSNNDFCLMSKGEITYNNDTKLFGTHGIVDFANAQKFDLRFHVLGNSAGRHGSGISIKYPFRRGKLYTISNTLAATSSGVGTGTINVGRLQFGLSNNSQPQSYCLFPSPERPISGSSLLFSRQGTQGNNNFNPMFSIP